MTWLPFFFFSSLPSLFIHFLFVFDRKCQARSWRGLSLWKGCLHSEFSTAGPKGRCEMRPGQEHRVAPSAKPRRDQHFQKQRAQQGPKGVQERPGVPASAGRPSCVSHASLLPGGQDGGTGEKRGLLGALLLPFLGQTGCLLLVGHRAPRSFLSAEPAATCRRFSQWEGLSFAVRSTQRSAALITPASEMGGGKGVTETLGDGRELCAYRWAALPVSCTRGIFLPSLTSWSCFLITLWADANLKKKSD